MAQQMLREHVVIAHGHEMVELRIDVIGPNRDFTDAGKARREKLLQDVIAVIDREIRALKVSD